MSEHARNWRKCAISLLGSIFLLEPCTIPARAITSQNRGREIEEYLDKSLKNRLLVLRAPVRAPSLVEFGVHGQPLGQILRGTESEDSALLFLDAVARDSYFELLAERVRSDEIHVDRKGKVFVRRGRAPLVSLMRLRFRLPHHVHSRGDFRPLLCQILSQVFLSQDEWRARCPRRG